jgi:hypothetical protein
MSLNDKAASALRRELAKCFPERAPDDAGHARLADALSDKVWHYTSSGNGAFITVHAPDGRTAFLQGADAEEFVRRESETNERYTIADLCREYSDILQPDALSDTARHTPGDWESVAFGDGCAINGPDGLRVAETMARDGDGEEVANGHLIAAAPSLLNALRAFVAISEPFAAEMEGDTHPDSVRGLEVLTEARAAIARATGGEG